MENTKKNIQTITLGGYNYPSLTLEGKLEISAKDNIIRIKSDKSKYIEIIFSNTTPSDYVLEIEKHISSTLACDGRVDIRVASLKEAPEDFLKYIQNEISNGHPSSDLYVLDLGTGIFITNKIDVSWGGTDCSN